jgi:hypothetical protein
MVDLISCTRCQRRKERHEFTRGKRTCKACARDDHRKYTYGVTTADLERMIRQQDGLCVICETPLGAKFCVDHIHDRGEVDGYVGGYVRGLLCYRCNIAVGHLENPMLNERILRYIAWHRALLDDVLETIASRTP